MKVKKQSFHSTHLKFKNKLRALHQLFYLIELAPSSNYTGKNLTATNYKMVWLVFLHYTHVKSMIYTLVSLCLYKSFLWLYPFKHRSSSYTCPDVYALT